MPVRISRSRAAAGLVALLSIGAACSSSDEACTTDARPALLVKVTRGAGGPPVCDANVTARDGNFSSMLTTYAFNNDCSYSGPTERAGTYDVQVTSGGQTKVVTGVKVTADACHVKTEQVRVELDP